MGTSYLVLGPLPTFQSNPQMTSCCMSLPGAGRRPARLRRLVNGNASEIIIFTSILEVVVRKSSRRAMILQSGKTACPPLAAGRTSLDLASPAAQVFPFALRRHPFAEKSQKGLELMTSAILRAREMLVKALASIIGPAAVARRRPELSWTCTESRLWRGHTSPLRNRMCKSP